jgi:two-component system, NarL family, nitrate/nitrite response regulator NarL
MPIRVVLGDDHPLFREGVVTALAVDGDIEVVGQAASADEALDLVQQTSPDVALLDVSMPGDGLHAAQRITSGHPKTRVVMLTVSDHEDDVARAMRAGAAGYVLKGVPVEELCEIVRRVHRGELYVAPSVAPAWKRAGTEKPPSAAVQDLSPRERQVLSLLARGLGNHEIALQLGTGEKNVKAHLTRVFQKLGVRNRVEAALLARTLGVADQAD